MQGFKNISNCLSDLKWRQKVRSLIKVLIPSLNGYEKIMREVILVLWAWFLKIFIRIKMSVKIFCSFSCVLDLEIELPNSFYSKLWHLMSKKGTIDNYNTCQPRLFMKSRTYSYFLPLSLLLIRSIKFSNMKLTWSILLLITHKGCICQVLGLTGNVIVLCLVIKACPQHLLMVQSCKVTVLTLRHFLPCEDTLTTQTMWERCGP